MAQHLETNINRKVFSIVRSPTLDTVAMVEKTIEAYSGEFKKTQLWEKLPRKVMWSTFVAILNYLEEINKIVISEEGIITYIWNPRLSAQMRSRKSY